MATAASNNTWRYLLHFAQLYKMLPVHPASPINDIKHHMARDTTLCRSFQDATCTPSFSYKWQQRHQTTHGERHYTLQKSSRCYRYTWLLLQMTAEASDTTWLDNRLWTAAVSSWLSLSSFPGLQTHAVA